MSKEVIMIMGIQAAGKSRLVSLYEAQGYARMNRDDMGGSLNGLNMKLEERMKKGEELFVLDNTYGTLDSRKPVIELAKRYGYTIRCVWVTTPIEDAQYNASYRILKKFMFNGQPPKFKLNDILGPNCSKLGKDQVCVPSIAQYAYKKTFHTPTLGEGFDIVEEAPFKRQMLPSTHKNKAVLLDYDGTLRKTKSGKKYPVDPSDIEILPHRREILDRYVHEGYMLLGVSNQSGIEKGDLDESTAIACFDATNKLLGSLIEYVYCPHHSFPIRCYCRKPLPGLGVYFIEKHLLNPSQCIMVGDSTSDKTFAGRCGFQYMPQDKFFK